MKLRIRGNSIRLRLTKPEVAALGERGSVEDAVTFGPQSRFVYAIERRATAKAVSTHFDGSRMVVIVPDGIAREFCESDRVGFDAKHNDVAVLVEKDWQCLAPRDEDEQDAYPHPRSGE